LQITALNYEAVSINLRETISTALESISFFTINSTICANDKGLHVIGW